MAKIVLFPFGMLWIFLVSMGLASINLSSFFPELNIKYGFAILIAIASATCIPLFPTQKFTSDKKTVVPAYKNKNGQFFYSQLILVFAYFLLELGFFGIPLFGLVRSEFLGFNVFHVVFYAYILFLNAWAAAEANVKVSLCALLVTGMIGSLILSRQMIMYSVIAFCIALVISKKLNVQKLVILFLLLSTLFGVLGDLRESGGVSIYAAGGANELGERMSSGIFWIWLYFATPIYNLMHNINDFFFLPRIDNFGSFFSQIFIPNFLANRLNLIPESPNLVMEHLTVASGFGLSVKYAGLLGVFIHAFCIKLFYVAGNILSIGKYRKVFIVHFTITALLFVFDNTFTRAEYFIAFIFIFSFGLICALRRS